MATRLPSPENGSWPLVQDLFDRGDPAFVDEVRRFHDPDVVGPFAAVWYADRRPTSRRLLLDYLDKPLNAPRHEPLIKRLFKLAEAAGDDEVMGRFMVLFDRAVRRTRRSRYVYDRKAKKSTTMEVAGPSSYSEMPKGKPEQFDDLNEWQRERYANSRLFSGRTRNYLRRRAWRYFRKLGRTSPDRYFAAVRVILPRYVDADVNDGLALLDNWGLVHILFHFSPALVSNPSGWVQAPKHKLSDVKPAPMFAELWKADPEPLLGLLDAAPSRAVRMWAIQMLRTEHPSALPGVALEKLVAWLGHRSPEMVTLAAELLKTGNRMAGVGADRLLEIVKNASPESLEMLCGLAAEALKPAQVTVRQAVDLAKVKSAVVAKLGFGLLQKKKPATEEDCRALLELAEAEAQHLRPEMVRWAAGVLATSSHFKSDWVVELLDSRHEEVRAEGWAWLEKEPRAMEDPHVWQQLLESPYDTIRIRIVEHLQKRTAGPAPLPTAGMDDELVRYLWAAVLLNVSRGSRAKPAVIDMVVNRLRQKPEEAEVLLPLLAVALRSLRKPEFRAGLLGVLGFVRDHPEAESLMNRLFPELKRVPIIAPAAAAS